METNQPTTLVHMADALNQLKKPEAEAYYQHALDAWPDDELLLFRYGNFREKKGEKGLAQHYYLKSLEQNPNNVFCIVAYADLLTDGPHEIVNYDLAEK